MSNAVTLDVASSFSDCQIRCLHYIDQILPGILQCQSRDVLLSVLSTFVIPSLTGRLNWTISNTWLGATFDNLLLASKAPGIVLQRTTRRGVEQNEAIIDNTVL